MIHINVNKSLNKQRLLIDKCVHVLLCILRNILMFYIFQHNKYLYFCHSVTAVI